jgi:hypothetical protein
MKAIEFETRLKDGTIYLPESYQHWEEGRKAKVIVLVSDSTEEESQNTGKDINRHAGKITLTQDPLAFQQAMRDEWP